MKVTKQYFMQLSHCALIKRDGIWRMKLRTKNNIENNHGENPENSLLSLQSSNNKKDGYYRTLRPWGMYRSDIRNSIVIILARIGNLKLTRCTVCNMVTASALFLKVNENKSTWKSPWWHFQQQSPQRLVDEYEHMNSRNDRWDL